MHNCSTVKVYLIYEACLVSCGFVPLCPLISRTALFRVLKYWPSPVCNYTHLKSVLKSYFFDFSETMQFSFMLCLSQQCQFWGKSSAFIFSLMPSSYLFSCASPHASFSVRRRGMQVRNQCLPYFPVCLSSFLAPFSSLHASLSMLPSLSLFLSW